MRRTQALYLSTAFLALAAGCPGARAQEAPAQQPSAQLEEIVITAEKRTEKLEDAPVSAVVVSGDKLADDNATDISDLNKLVPSVNMNGTINGRVPLGMRGISSNSNESTVGVSSGVEILIDGVPVPSDSYAGNQMEDVDSIEVLKGPQATLGGRTASAGEIDVLTHKPSDVWTGSLTATFTDDDEQHLQGFISGPVSDKVDVSLAGWGHHTDEPITNLFTGNNTYVDDYGFRAKILVKPTDDLDMTLSTRLSATQSYGMNFVYSYLTPGATLLGIPAPIPFLTQAALLKGITPSVNNQTYNSPVLQSGSKTYDNDVSLDLNYRFDGFTLSSTTAYQHEAQRNTQDLFTVADYFFTLLTGGHAPFPNYQTQWEDVSQTSEEVKIVSPADQPLTYVAGFFYSDSSVDESYFRTLAPAAVNYNVIPDTATYDVYARGTWHFLPTTALVAGLRYNYDDLSYTDKQTVFVPGCANCASSGSDQSSAVVGDISLQQQLDTESQVYATYARGYAPKVYNTSAVGYCPNPVANPATCPGNAMAPLVPVGQEKINAFELGSKGQYFDNTLRVNAALFYTIYNNYQIQIFQAVAGQLNPPLNLTSAGQAETKGAELDTTWKATPDLTLTFNAAYIDAVFTDYPNAPCYGAGIALQTASEGCVTKTLIVGGAPEVTSTQNVAGKPMPNSPKFKFDLGATQDIPLAIPFDLVLGGDFSYRTSAEMLADQNPEARQGAFGILNLNASLVSTSGAYSITLFVDNVANQHYVVDMEDFWSSPWSANAVVVQPARDANRFFGVRLNASF